MDRQVGPGHFFISDTGLVCASSLTLRVPGVLYLGSILGDALSVIRTAEHLRSLSGMGATPFALDIAMAKRNGIDEGSHPEARPDGLLLRTDQYEGIAVLLPMRIHLPLYYIEGRETFTPTINQFVEDVFNAGGSDNPAHLEINWDQAG